MRLKFEGRETRKPDANSRYKNDPRALFYFIADLNHSGIK